MSNKWSLLFQLICKLLVGFLIFLSFDYSAVCQTENEKAFTSVPVTQRHQLNVRLQELIKLDRSKEWGGGV